MSFSRFKSKEKNKYLRSALFSASHLFFNSKNKMAKFNLKKTLAQMAIAPFSLLALVKEASAGNPNLETLYPKEIYSNTQFELTYDATEFPHMQSALAQYCQVIINQSPQVIYQAINGPQCVSPSGNAGPWIDLSVEAGKKLTETFQICLNNAMQQLCDDYYNQNQSGGSHSNNNVSTKTILIILGCIAGISACACCIYWGVKRKENSQAESNRTPSYNPYYTAPSAPLLQSTQTVPIVQSAPVVVARPAPAIILESSHHHDYHHPPVHYSPPIHHSPVHHHSSVIWNNHQPHNESHDHAHHSSVAWGHHPSH